MCVCEVVCGCNRQTATASAPYTSPWQCLHMGYINHRWRQPGIIPPPHNKPQGNEEMKSRQDISPSLWLGHWSLINCIKINIHQTLLRNESWRTLRVNLIFGKTENSYYGFRSSFNFPSFFLFAFNIKVPNEQNTYTYCIKWDKIDDFLSSSRWHPGIGIPNASAHHLAAFYFDFERLDSSTSHFQLSF